jgi:hypothetical protein
LVVRYEHYFATKNIIVRRKKSYAPRKKSVRHNIVTNEFGDAQKKTTNSSTQFNTRKKYPFTRVVVDKFPVLRQKSATKCCSVTTKCRYILSIKRSVGGVQKKWIRHNNTNHIHSCHTTYYTHYTT